MKHYIAKWKTYEFVQSPLCGYPQRETKQRGQVVYAKSAIQVVDMIRHIDPNASYIEVDEYKET